MLWYNIVSMETNTISNNVWMCKLRKKPLSKKYNYQSHMERCKVYKDHLKANCIDDESKQQLKQDILNVFKLFLDAFKIDVVNVNTSKNIKQSYNFKISLI